MEARASLGHSVIVRGKDTEKYSFKTEMQGFFFLKYVFIALWTFVNVGICLGFKNCLDLNGFAWIRHHNRIPLYLDRIKGKWTFIIGIFFISLCRTYYGRRCEFRRRSRSCGPVRHGGAYTDGCNFCQCHDGILTCFPNILDCGKS